MCGIAGFCLGPGKDRTEEDYSTIREEFTRLLVNCQVRGVDAAGAFVVNKGIGNIFYYKAPKKASRLTEDAQFLSLMDKIGPDTVAVIGHTRAATTGSPKENSNNHPIIDDPIIGVHNGMIRNHRELGRLYTKVAEVDSAAIMALLRDSSTEKPLTVNDLVTRLPELEGGYAIAVVDAQKPDGIFLARNSNPICMTRNYKLGYLAFASTGEILRETFGEKTRTFLMPAHSVCRIGRGCMKKKVKFYAEEAGEEPAPIETQTKMELPTATVKKGKNRKSRKNPKWLIHAKRKIHPDADLTKELPVVKVVWIPSERYADKYQQIYMEGAVERKDGYKLLEGTDLQITKQCTCPSRIQGNNPSWSCEQQACECDAFDFTGLGNGLTVHHHERYIY